MAELTQKYSSDSLNNIDIKIKNILENIYLKFENELVNYEYVPYQNLSNIQLGNQIIYIKKNIFIKKSGILYKILNDDYFQLCNKNRSKKWFINKNEYIFFNKIRNDGALRYALQNLINNDFNFKKDNYILQNSLYTYKKTPKIIH
jgi:hypothetical protein